MQRFNFCMLTRCDVSAVYTRIHVTGVKKLFGSGKPSKRGLTWLTREINTRFVTYSEATVKSALWLWCSFPNNTLLLLGFKYSTFVSYLPSFIADHICSRKHAPYSVIAFLCLCLTVSVCPSHAGIVSKRLNVSLKFFNVHGIQSCCPRGSSRTNPQVVVLVLD